MDKRVELTEEEIKAIKAITGITIITDEVTAEHMNEVKEIVASDGTNVRDMLCEIAYGYNTSTIIDYVMHGAITYTDSGESAIKHLAKLLKMHNDGIEEADTDVIMEHMDVLLAIMSTFSNVAEPGDEDGYEDDEKGVAQ